MKPTNPPKRFTLRKLSEAKPTFGATDICILHHFELTELRPDVGGNTMGKLDAINFVSMPHNMTQVDVQEDREERDMSFVGGPSRTMMVRRSITMKMSAVDHRIAFHGEIAASAGMQIEMMGIHKLVWRVWASTQESAVAKLLTCGLSWHLLVDCEYVFFFVGTSMDNKSTVGVIAHLGKERINGMTVKLADTVLPPDASMRRALSRIYFNVMFDGSITPGSV